MSKVPEQMEVDVPEDIRMLWEERGGEVVKYPNPVLRQAARPIAHPNEATRQLVERMKKVMVEDYGVGLAAPQLGVSQRLFVYKLPEKEAPWRVCINPKIVSMKGEQIGAEGCLSIPWLNGDVKRAREVVLKGHDLNGHPFRRRATDFEARVIQHELDHLDGILFIDRADQETLGWFVPGEDEDDSDEPEVRAE